jgi:hypothetical protein
LGRGTTVLGFELRASCLLGLLGRCSYHLDYSTRSYFLNCDNFWSRIAFLFEDKIRVSCSDRRWIETNWTLLKDKQMFGLASYFQNRLLEFICRFVGSWLTIYINSKKKKNADEQTCNSDL